MAKKKSDSESEAKPKAAKSPAKASTAKAKSPATKSAAEKPATEQPAGKSAKKSTKPETKAEKKPANSSAAPTSPMIDTSLAAQAAAAMVLNRGATGSTAGTAAPKESASFKAFKQNVNKPTGLGGVLGGGFQQKKGSGNQPSGGGKQVGHNQTFGSDVTRTGVPRRTSG